MSATVTVFEAARQVSCIQAAEILSLPLKRSGSKAYACCLFHTEKSPSMCLYPDGGGFYCFGCHESGDAIKLYAKALRLDPLEAAKRLCADFHLSCDPPKAQKRAGAFPLRQLPTRMNVTEFGKMIETWRNTRIDSLLKQKRSAEAAVSALTEEYQSSGKDISSLWDNASWVEALTAISDAQTEIDRLDTLTLPELYSEIKEVSYESNGRIVAPRATSAG